MIFAVQVTSADPAAWIPLLVLVIYLTVLLGLGWLGYRRSTGGEEDYYLAGRSQGWIVSSFTIMATFFSSFALLGAPGMVYREGVVFALVSLNVPVAGFCVYLFGDRIRRLCSRARRSRSSSSLRCTPSTGRSRRWCRGFRRSRFWLSDYRFGP